MNWITDHRSSGNSVSAKMIIFEARRLAVAHNITDFSGTTSWCYRFMKRHELSMHTQTRIVKKMPAEYETKILQFHKFVVAASKKSCHVKLGQIGNMDKVL
jgi:hypothetical protein